VISIRAGQPIVPGSLFLASRAFAALHWFAMRLGMYLIGQFVEHIGIVIIEPFLGFCVVWVVGVGDEHTD
jgi:hypothetical protein